LLEEAAKIMGSVQLGISLTKADIQDIAAFMRTTTGAQPVISHPVLPAPTDETPKPILD
jgi:cytochrome c peroxidase